MNTADTDRLVSTENVRTYTLPLIKAKMFRLFITTHCCDIRMTCKCAVWKQRDLSFRAHGFLSAVWLCRSHSTQKSLTISSSDDVSPIKILGVQCPQKISGLVFPDQ